MAPRVRLSTAAIRDLARQRAYMTQPGAGQPAARKLAALLRQLERLPDEIPQHPIDRFRPAYRAATVGGFTILFRPDRGGVFVRRIYGPGQDRG